MTLLNRVMKEFKNILIRFQTKIDNLSQRPTVESLFSFIKENENTSKKSQTLLGICYNYYTYSAENVLFFIETKGEGVEHILEFKITYTDTTHPFTWYHYRSFSINDNPSLPDPPLDIASAIDSLTTKGA